MSYLAVLFGLGLFVGFAHTQDTGEVVLYSETNFQGKITRKINL